MVKQSQSGSDHPIRAAASENDETCGIIDISSKGMNSSSLRTMPKFIGSPVAKITVLRPASGLICSTTAEKGCGHSWISALVFGRKLKSRVEPTMTSVDLIARRARLERPSQPSSPMPTTVNHLFIGYHSLMR